MCTVWVFTVNNIWLCMISAKALGANSKQCCNRGCTKKVRWNPGNHDRILQQETHGCGNCYPDKVKTLTTVIRIAILSWQHKPSEVGQTDRFQYVMSCRRACWITSLCVVVVICVALVNTHTHTHRQRALDCLYCSLRQLS